MATCPRCNDPVSAGAATCFGCGLPLDAAEAYAQRVPGGQPGPHRPVWVYLVVGVYVLLAGTVTFGPAVVSGFDGERGGFLAALLYALVLSACGASLLVIPIRAARDLPTTQRSIWFPLVGSATLAALVFAGLAVASHEFTFGGTGRSGAEAAERAIWIALPLVWLGWAVLFGVMAFRTDPPRFAGRLYKSLLAGSLMELLVAVLMHMVVRQRAYCCAGFGTGFGIGIGLLVMLVALGPAIVFLFYGRYRQAYVRHTPKPE